MRQHVLPALRLTLACIVLFCGIYTVVVLGLAQIVQGRGLGETISLHGKVVGYALEGQTFNQDKYFWGRPSAVGYNAAGSGASNKGPFNADYLKDVATKIDTFLTYNPRVTKDQIPAELVTYSGSGLDPDLSPTAALVQVSRVAAARGLSEMAVKDLVNRQTEAPLLGIFGPATLNVLKLNVALDELK